MFREIKFRAWDIISKRMLEYEEIMDLPMGEVFHKKPEQRNFEVMQYIGFKDNKKTEDYPCGQEIYEGDIVRITGYSIEVGIIEYKEYKFCLRTKSSWSSYYYSNLEKTTVYNDYRERIDITFNFEVLGNIFENPELLKKYDIE